MMMLNSIIKLREVVLVKVAQIKYFEPGIEINHGEEVCMNTLKHIEQ